MLFLVFLSLCELRQLTPVIFTWGILRLSLSGIESTVVIRTNHSVWIMAYLELC